MSLVSPERQERSSTVLIVEADAALRAALRLLLQASGYLVRAASLVPGLAPEAPFAQRLRLDDAPAPLAPSVVDLAVIELAAFDSAEGHAALALARELASLNRPVVFCVRRHEGDALAAALACGGFAYFVKPVEPALLLRSLPVWLARAAELRQLKRECGSLLDALTASRLVGTAVGILSERHRLTPEQAFDDLRRQARAGRRAIAEQARQVTGERGGDRRV